MQATLAIEIQAQLQQELQVGLSDSDREKYLQAVTMEVYSRHDLDVKAFLSPEQSARLRQIILQDAGTDALEDPEVAKELAITKDQQEKLKALHRHVDQRLKEIIAPDENGEINNRLIAGRVAVLMIDRDRKANEILTVSQQDKLEELKGEPFELWQFPPQFAGDGPRMPFSTRQGGLMELALRDAVRKELGIAKDAPQVIALRTLSEAYSEEYEKQLQKELHNNGQAGPIESERIAFRVQTQFGPELKKLLTPEQLTRLRQINWQLKWQISPTYALFDPAVEQALEITREQREQLRRWTWR